MAKPAKIGIRLEGTDTVGRAWELLFLGRVRPARPGESQHSAECIFVAREFDGTNIGPRMSEISSRWVGVNSLAGIKPGEIWIDEIINSTPMRVLKPEIPNPSLEEIRVSLFNPQAAYESEIQSFFKDQLPVILGEARGTMGLQLFGKKAGGPSFYTVFIPSIEFHRFLVFRTDDLCDALFHVGFGKLIDLEQSLYQVEEGKEPFVKIVSNANLKKTDLKNIAMMLGDSTCRYLRARISGGIRASGNEPRYLYARLSWTKKTKIRVKGFTIPNCSERGDIFIVQSIEHTSHKPDFNEIIYEHISTLTTNPGIDPDNLTVGGKNGLRMGGELPQSDENWPASDTPIAQHIRPVLSPPDDWEPSIDRRELVINRDTNADITTRIADNRNAVDISTGSTGSSSSESGRIRIRMDDEDVAGHPFERFQLLWEVCAEIALNMNGVMRAVVGSEAAEVPLKINGADQPLIRIANFAKIPRNRFFRRSLMIELFIQRKYIYLVEIEEVLRSDKFALALLAKRSFGQISIAEIDQFYGAAAKIRFAWRDRENASEDRKELRKPLNDFLNDKRLFSAIHSSPRTSREGLQNYIESKIRNEFQIIRLLPDNPLH